MTTKGFEKYITPLTLDPSAEYAAAIRKVKTLRGLKQVLIYYKCFAADALSVARTMTEDEMPIFKAELKKAEGKQSKEWIENFNKRYGIIAVPATLSMINMFAYEANVLWGIAYQQYKKYGKDGKESKN